MVGTEAVAFTISGATNPVSYSGSATYLGGTADISVGRFVGNVSDEGTWLRSLEGSIRGGPRNLDSGFSEISIVFQAAVPKPVVPKYTTSGVRRPSER